MAALDLPPKLWAPSRPAIVRAGELPRSPAAVRGIETKKAVLPGIAPISCFPTAPPVYVFRGSDSIITNTAAPSFADKDIGPAASDRVAVVFIGGRDDGSGSPVISSPTIGGVSATIIRQDFTNTRELRALIYALVPTGTSATITWTTNVTLERSAIGWWTITGLSQLSPRASSISSFADPLSFSRTVLDQGIFIGGALALTTAAFDPTGSTAGLVEDFDFAVEASIQVASYSGQFSPGQSVTVALDTDTSIRALSSEWR